MSTMADIDNDDAVPSVHPFKVINNKTTRNVELYGKDYDAQLEACSDFLRLSSLRQTCKNRVNSRRVGLSCHCLSLLSNPLHCEAVGLWMVDFNKMEKEAQQCSIMEKIRHADDLDKIAAENRKRGPKRIYHLPFIMPTDDDDDSDNDGNEGGDEDRAKAISTLNGHRICQSALMELIGVQKVWWATCRKHITLGTPPVHKLKGKASNRKRQFVNEEEAELIDFFTEMKELGEPSATRFVLDRTGGLSTRDNDVEVAYLPPSWSKMNLYQRYAVSRGWDASTDSIGIVTKIARIGEEQKRLCSWFVFYYYWKMNFPKLRVRRRIEDICSQCYIFQNTYKYRKRPCCRNNNQMNSDDNNLLDESDESEDEDDEEVPSSAPNPPAALEDKSDNGNGDGGNGDDGNVNNDDVDGDDVEDDDVSVDPDILANEEKIIKAAKHVTMAHAMRVLFRSFMVQANADCVSKDIEPSAMLTLLVADYCQKLELPAFFSQQPGDTYYLSPLSVNCFGVVDCSNPKAHLHAHVYHEGQGKCGGNNVASLLLKTLESKGLLNRNKPPGKKLVSVFDNCPGQNKNGMVLKLVAWLVEMDYFEEVEFMFLIVGHTKNPADRLFNLLKQRYRSMNLFTMKDLIECVNGNASVTAVQSEGDDFKDFMAYQKEFYKPFATNTILKYHIFSSHKDDKGVIRYYESDSERQEEKTLLADAARLIKNAPLDQGDAQKLEELQEKLKEIKANTTQSLAKIPGDPNRKAAMTEASMATLKVPGIKDIKQVEMTKFKKFVPLAFKMNPIYKTPDSSVTQKIKDQKNTKVRERNKKRKKANKMEDTTKDKGGSSCKDEGLLI
jgi:hypothetical protein